ncbi:MAG: hypothetical protein GXX01_03925 [Clostridiales bacterium]|nr:hypothetical protein [Clostridiales bacterium]
MKIGIPRALLYSIYLPLWKTFLESLGHQIVMSSHTDKKILDNGVKFCVDDACLPIKIFHGHVMDLAHKTDAVLVPRLVSIHPEEYICPKFIGLPEMIKHSVPGSPSLLVMDYNARSGTEKAYHGMKTLGRELGASEKLIKRALSEARIRQAEHERRMEREKGLNPAHALDGKGMEGIIRLEQGTIGLIGHPYLVYDQFINMDICNKLAARGYGTVFPENIPMADIEAACKRYPKKMFWSYGKRLLGAGLTMMGDRQVDGLILLTSFGCGIDSFVDELLVIANRRKYKLPLTIITLDEHTGQAGFNTRLEAFIDMIEWRRRYDNYIPAHGLAVYTGKGTFR